MDFYPHSALKPRCGRTVLVVPIQSTHCPYLQDRLEPTAAQEQEHDREDTPAERRSLRDPREVVHILLDSELLGLEH